jgi:DNA-binding transcriptional ArsR family regulator
MAGVYDDPIPEPDLEDVAIALQARLRSCAWKVRLHMLLHLLYQPREVTWLAETIGCELSVASRHLAALREEGLVECRREGNRRVQMLSPVVRSEYQGGMVHLAVRAGCGAVVTLSLPARALKPVVVVRGRRAAAKKQRTAARA